MWQCINLDSTAGDEWKGFTPIMVNMHARAVHAQYTIFTYIEVAKWYRFVVVGYICIPYNTYISDKPAVRNVNTEYALFYF